MRQWGMPTTTRAATEADLPMLSGLDRHLRDADLAQVVSLGRVLVAVADGEVRGLLRWGLLWDEIPFMNLLMVDPGHRRRGLGSSLVRAWEGVHAAAGHRMVLTSTQADEQAQHFFRRLGYVDSGALLLPGEPTELILRKELARQAGSPRSAPSR